MWHQYGLIFYFIGKDSFHLCTLSASMSFFSFCCVVIGKLFWFGMFSGNILICSSALLVPFIEAVIGIYRKASCCRTEI